MSHPPDSSQPLIYEIHLAGHLSAQWSDWFEGLSVSLQPDGTTLLSGPVVDQAALYGVLKKVRDVGLPLLAVNALHVRGEK